MSYKWKFVALSTFWCLFLIMCLFYFPKLHKAASSESALRFHILFEDKCQEFQILYQSYRVLGYSFILFHCRCPNNFPSLEVLGSGSQGTVLNNKGISTTGSSAAMAMPRVQKGPESTLAYAGSPTGPSRLYTPKNPFYCFNLPPHSGISWPLNSHVGRLWNPANFKTGPKS